MPPILDNQALYERLKARPFLIAGPCVIESESLVMQVAERMSAWRERYGEQMEFVFKASFDKANRTSVEGFRGGGMEAGLEILQRVRERFALPVLTDVHESAQVAQVAAVVDIVQIPAFLCRQTDLLLAAGNAGKIVNIKKAQFLSPAEMRYPAQKVASTGNAKILLTERGTMFGYNNLVVDYTGFAEMAKLGFPLVFDATHSVQKPGAAGGKSGGNREFAPILARAAAAVGVRGFFVETHPEPEKALSDGANMVYLDQMPTLIERLLQVAALVEGW